MGCCHSYPKRSRVGTTNVNNSYHSKIVNQLFRFDIGDKNSIYNKLKDLKNSQIHELFDYDFMICDYSQITALEYILEANIKNICNSDYRMSYEIRQLFKDEIGNDKIYLFKIHIQFLGCNVIQLCTCLLTILDLIPHKFLSSRYENFTESYDEIIKEILNKLLRLNTSSKTSTIFIPGLNFCENLMFKNIVFFDDIPKQYGTFVSDSYKQNGCVICFERVRDQLFIPCNHYAVCEKCLRLIKSCPICRTNIDRSINVINV